MKELVSLTSCHMRKTKHQKKGSCHRDRAGRVTRTKEKRIVDASHQRTNVEEEIEKRRINKNEMSKTDVERRRG